MQEIASTQLTLRPSSSKPCVWTERYRPISCLSHWVALRSTPRKGFTANQCLSLLRRADYRRSAGARLTYSPFAPMCANAFEDQRQLCPLDFRYIDTVDKDDLPVQMVIRFFGVKIPQTRFI